MEENKVTWSKPKVGGAVYRAPLGTTLPTDAVTALDAAFTSMGYISEDGLTHSATPETEKVKAWGGDTVLVLQTDKTVTYTATFIEELNTEVQKTVHGNDNVSGDLDTGLTVTTTSAPLEEASYVIEEILKGNIKKRTVIPSATVSEVGEVTDADNAAIGYAITLEVVCNSDGEFDHKYYQKEA